VGVCIDHIVLWVDDPLRSLVFYQDVLGAEGVRVGDFTSGDASFPSIRLSADTIIDLMPRANSAAADSMAGVEGSAGHPVNHVCLAMSQADYDALSARLEARQIDTSARVKRNFGARGLAEEAFYFHDLDGNVIEARYYAQR
jgi:catechol 2,3-dioxygenase-like lactoylglutathione lyase family enzyme